VIRFVQVVTWSPGFRYAIIAWLPSCCGVLPVGPHSAHASEPSSPSRSMYDDPSVEAPAKADNTGGDFSGIFECYLVRRRSGLTVYSFSPEGSRAELVERRSFVAYTLVPSASPAPSPLGLRQKARERPDRSMAGFRLGAALSLVAQRSCWWCETMGVKWMQLRTQERRRRLGNHIERVTR